MKIALITAETVQLWLGVVLAARRVDGCQTEVVRWDDANPQSSMQVRNFSTQT